MSTLISLLGVFPSQLYEDVHTVEKGEESNVFYLKFVDKESMWKCVALKRLHRQVKLY